TPFHVQRVTPDARGAVEVTASVRLALERRTQSTPVRPSVPARFKRDSRIDQVVAGVEFLDRGAAAAAAIEIVKATDALGQNELFEALLNYQDFPDDNEFLMRALSIIESCAEFAPWLIDHGT